MLTINFFFPGNPYEHTYSFNISKTFYDMIELLKDKIYQNNNRDIFLTLNGKELKYDDNTLLSNCGIKNMDNIYVRYDDFIDINVLERNEIREGIKHYSKWPTIPQLYINREFIGGCDITKELYSSGELIKIIQNSAK